MSRTAARRAWRWPRHSHQADAACETMVISFLCASAPLPDIAQHLQSIREVMLPDGSLALFRFQDTHVTTHLWPLLRTGQANQILWGQHTGGPCPMCAALGTP
ncbi:MAG: DUF4123 domain-containing protein [Burkholderiaceae bacterium]|nr:MAG: DUF4123 domain-containing protein [Burkholderiaceae bacterium]